MDRIFRLGCGGEDIRPHGSTDGTFGKTAFGCAKCGWAGIGSQLLTYQNPIGGRVTP